MEINQALIGPVAFDSETAFSSPQHFVKGCSYTISMWAWIWPSREFDLTLFRARDLEGKKNFYDKSLTLYPSVIFNLHHKPNQFFFGAEIDEAGFPVGLFGGEETLVPFMKWVHIAVVISENEMNGYINGKKCTKEPVILSDAKKSKCPYNRMGLSSSSTSPISPFPYVNNTALEIFGLKGTRSTPGIVQDVLVIRGEGAALNEAQLQALMEMRPPQPLPTLNSLSSNYFNIVSAEDGLQGEAGIYSTDNEMMHSSAPQDITTDSSMAVTSTTGTNTHETNLTIPKKLNYTTTSLKKDPKKAINKAYRKFGEDPLMSEHHHSLNDVLSAYYNKSLELISVFFHEEEESRTNIPNGINDGGELDTIENGGAGERLLRDLVRRTHYSGKALVKIKRSMQQQKQQNDQSDKAVSIEKMVNDYDTNVKLLIQELHQASLLWLNGRHTNVNSDTALSIIEWRNRYYERSQSALMMAMFLTDDYTALHEELKYDATWDYLYSSREAQPFHLMLGYRIGYDMKESIDILSKQELLEVLNTLTDEEMHKKLIEELTRNSADFARSLVEAEKVALKEIGIDVDENPLLEGILTFNNDESELSKNSREYTEAVFQGAKVVKEALMPSLYPTSTAGDGGEFLQQEGTSMEQLETVATTTDVEGQLHGLEYCKSSEEGTSNELHVTTEVLSDGEFEVWKHPDEFYRCIKKKRSSIDETAVSDNVFIKTLKGLPLPTADYGRLAPGIKSESNTRRKKETHPSSPSPPSSSALTQNQCMASLVYYFPVAQYVVSHKDSSPGIAPLERVLIAETNNLHGHAGLEDELHILREVEGFAGDAEADIWLARRYYYGFGGLEQDQEMALKHFRRAAEQNNAEALYNMGVFYDHGSGGLEVNKQLAWEYFDKSAHHANPFPMALEVVGNHHLGYNDIFPIDIEKAKYYYERAASLGSPEGHYSLARLYLDLGGYVDVKERVVNVPQAMVHLAYAASGGHVRALNVIASAIYDPDSWFHEYERDIQRNIVISAYEREILEKEEEHEGLFIKSGSEQYFADEAKFLFKAEARERRERKALQRNKIMHEADPQWAYTPGQLIVINLPEGPLSVQLPTVSTDHDSSAVEPMPLCQVALSITKHLSEMTYYTNDVMKKALTAFLEKDYYGALDYYDEAAELGIYTAHENSIHLYELIMKQECDASRANGLANVVSIYNGVKSFLYGDAANHTGQDGEDVHTSNSESGGVGGIDDESVDDDAMDSDAFYTSSTSNSIWNGRKQKQCRRYFQRSLFRRYIHLANIARSPTATREIASQLISYEYPFDHVDEVVVDSSTAGGLHVRPTGEQAVRLYAYNGVQGDVQSLVTLGWALQSGSIPGIKKNLTAAKSVFTSARKIELTSGSLQNNMGYDGQSTYGFAPMIGEVVVDAELWVEENWLGKNFAGKNVNAAAGVLLSGGDNNDTLIAASMTFIGGGLVDTNNYLDVCVLSILLVLLIILWHFRKRR